MILLPLTEHLKQKAAKVKQGEYLRFMHLICKGRNITLQLILYYCFLGSVYSVDKADRLSNCCYFTVAFDLIAGSEAHKKQKKKPVQNTGLSF